MLAGVLYFDGRPVPEADQEALRSGFAADSRVELHRSEWLLMAADQRALSGLFTSAGGNLCALDGKLDNGNEVAAASGGRELRGASEASLALHLYEAQGAEGFSRLIGDWSLAVWDARERTLLLGCDYAGVRPLYYHWTAQRLVWSTSLAHMVRWTGASQLDESYAAEFLAYGWVVGRTPYQGIGPVPAGSVVRADAKGISTSKIWSLPIDRTVEYAQESEYEDRLRELFREAVAVRLETDGPVCAELSGGLDSSSIVCTADRIISSGAARTSGLTTFSYRYADSPDEKFYRAVEAVCNVSPVHLQTENYPPVSVRDYGNAQPASWVPRWEEVARRTAELGSHVFLTGQFGDLLMGNWLDDSEQVADYVRRGQFAKAVSEAFSWSQSLRVPVYSILWRGVRPDAARNGDLATSVAEHRVHGDSLQPEIRKLLMPRERRRAQTKLLRQAAPSRRKRLLALHQFLECRTFQSPEALQPIRYSHPYLHRPLVEFMLAIPPGVVCRPGEPRRLMRRALRGVVPDVILDRRSKGNYEGMFIAALRPCAQELLRDINGSRLVQLGFVDRESLEARLDRLVQGLDCNQPQLRQVILFEFWLRNSEGKRVAGKPRSFTQAS